MRRSLLTYMLRSTPCALRLRADKRCDGRVAAALAGLLVSALLATASLARAHADERPQAPASATHPCGLPGLAADFPADPNGIPTRSLADRELWQLLLAHSAVNAAVVELLTRCHVTGRPFGHPDWRTCVLSRAGD
ncbi:hypothetical protein [Falsiroseomonas oryziterrae]|uniref:hypothetical protein n=1 Tax=Falsiroseomonas oryziterrae TaxID=2911368 RepID=UPI001F1B5DC4|nr:hypothetical protein [Roseomonas sp. NPKOSM-4]